MATAKKSSKTTALTVWEEEMRAKAQMQAKAEKPMGFAKQIKFGAAGVQIDDATVDEIQVVVLGALHENQYYDTGYNPNQPTSPVCYAFGERDDEDADDNMVPHQDAEKVQGTDSINEEEGVRADDASCSNCWANVMGTAETGRGKACKNIRRLALVTPDALESAESLAEAELRLAKLPVTSVANWAKYVNKVAEEVGRPTFGVVTTIKAVPDNKTQFKVVFSFEELVNFDQALYDAMNKKVDEAYRILSSPYPKNSEMEAQPVKPQGRMAQRMGAGKVAGKSAKPMPGRKAGGKY